MAYYIFYLSATAPKALRGAFPFMEEGIQYFFLCDEASVQMTANTVTVPARIALTEPGTEHWSDHSGTIALASHLFDYWLRIPRPLEKVTLGLPMGAVADDLDVQEADFLGSAADRPRPAPRAPSKPQGR